MALAGAREIPKGVLQYADCMAQCSASGAATAVVQKQLAIFHDSSGAATAYTVTQWPNRAFVFTSSTATYLVLGRTAQEHVLWAHKVGTGEVTPIEVLDEDGKWVPMCVDAVEVQPAGPGWDVLARVRTEGIRLQLCVYLHKQMWRPAGGTTTSGTTPSPCSARAALALGGTAAESDADAHVRGLGAAAISAAPIEPTGGHDSPSPPHAENLGATQRGAGSLRAGSAVRSGTGGVPGAAVPVRRSQPALGSGEQAQLGGGRPAAIAAPAAALDERLQSPGRETHPKASEVMGLAEQQAACMEEGPAERNVNVALSDHLRPDDDLGEAVQEQATQGSRVHPSQLQRSLEGAGSGAALNGSRSSGLDQVTALGRKRTLDFPATGPAAKRTACEGPASKARPTVPSPVPQPLAPARGEGTPAAPVLDLQPEWPSTKDTVMNSQGTGALSGADEDDGEEEEEEEAAEAEEDEDEEEEECSAREEGPRRSEPLEQVATTDRHRRHTLEQQLGALGETSSEEEEDGGEGDAEAATEVNPAQAAVRRPELGAYTHLIDMLHPMPMPARTSTRLERCRIPSVHVGAGSPVAAGAPKGYPAPPAVLDTLKGASSADWAAAEVFHRYGACKFKRCKLSVALESVKSTFEEYHPEGYSKKAPYLSHELGLSAQAENTTEVLFVLLRYDDMGEGQQKGKVILLPAQLELLRVPEAQFAEDFPPRGTPSAADGGRNVVADHFTEARDAWYDEWTALEHFLVQRGKQALDGLEVCALSSIIADPDSLDANSRAWLQVQGHAAAGTTHGSQGMTDESEASGAAHGVDAAGTPHAAGKSRAAAAGDSSDSDAFAVTVRRHDGSSCDIRTFGSGTSKKWKDKLQVLLSKPRLVDRSAGPPHRVCKLDLLANMGLALRPQKGGDVFANPGAMVDIIKGGQASLDWIVGPEDVVSDCSLAQKLNVADCVFKISFSSYEDLKLARPCAAVRFRMADLKTKKQSIKPQ